MALKITRGKKHRNTYMNLFGKAYEDIPKSVYAAIAVSFAHLIEEDDTEKALTLIYKEWEVLHSNGIVPQKPKARPV